MSSVRARLLCAPSYLRLTSFREYHDGHSKLTVPILSFLPILMSVQSRTKLDRSLAMLLHFGTACGILGTLLLATFVSKDHKAR